VTSAAADDPFDEFWALFSGELEDYLTTVETILAASPVDTTRVDELFRAFHSIKGGAAALAMRCIETVAHAAEDVLHLVRNGRKTLTTEVVSAMLAAVDEIRRLQDVAMATRQDQPVNQAVVALLKSHRTEDGGPPAPSAARAPAPAPAPPPITAAVSVAPPPVAAPAPLPAAPAPPPVYALAFEDDALLTLQDAVLGLIGVVDDGDPEGAAAALAEAALAAGLSGVAGVARRLEAADADGRRWAWLELTSLLRCVETACGGSVGAYALSAALETTFAELLLEQVGSLKSAPTDPVGWLRVMRLLAAMEIAPAAELADLIAARLLTGDDPGDADAVADMLALLGISLTSGMETPLEEITALRDAQLVAVGLAPPADPGAAPQAVGAAHEWPLESLIRLAEAVAAAQTPALALLDLESDPHAVDAVNEILHGQTAVYNRSRLDLGAGLFEYLIVAADFSALARRMADVDPNRRCLRSLRSADAAATPGPEALPQPVAPPPPPVVAPPPPVVATSPPPVAPVAPAPSPVAAAPSPAPAGAARPADAVVRVPSAAIDGFMDLIGELRLGLTSLGLVLDENGADGAGTGGRRATTDAMRRLERAVRSLYDGALSLRVVPIGTLFSRLMRPIRDTAVLVGKEVALTTAGDDVQVDKAMIEMLVDPLTHIVRNSVDHGIESPERRLAAGKPRDGAIRIRARQAASLAIIEVEDDGGGIDVARVREKAVSKGLITAAEAAALSDDDSTQLILLPGFSTRDEVTATSGRGVGMDIVVTAIKKLGGRLSISSRLGTGTRMVIEFPVTAAMQRVLATELCGQTIAIHERAVQEVLQLPYADLQRLGGRLALSLRGRFLPVVDLAALLRLKDPGAPPPDKAVVVVADNGETQLGLLVEQLAVRREIFFKRLHPLIESNPLIAGAAVIGAGTVIFALDTQALFAAVTAWEEGACFAE
jgi:two-component system, chemotaxis family, sensor kinase CheA